MARLNSPASASATLRTSQKLRRMSPIAVATGGEIAFKRMPLSTASTAQDRVIVSTAALAAP